MDQRRQTDRNFDRSERIVLAACFDLFAGRKFAFYPWLVRRCPGWIKNDLLRLSHASRQWEFRITDTNLITFLELTVLKDIHSISWSIHDYSCVGRNCIWPSREHRFVTSSRPALPNQI